jgi:N-methylhydantoinase A/oxoprolinase/acetone carboxylase beta subunit
MIPHVAALIASVEATLARFGIDAPLMMVKGDGSLASAAAALARPVGTVLSGPAASVIGACALSGRRNGVVADMGGTTTDIAVVRGGSPELAFDGAVIGGWRPMIEAVRVYAIGIGGDSEVRFGGIGEIVVGPRRVVPLSLLVHQHPALLAVLARQQNETPHPAQARFALRLQGDATLLEGLPEAEREAWERLCRAPVDMEQANATDRGLARALARLERRGLAIYTGFTPTDAAHVLGMSDHWSREGARLGALIWSRKMRAIHGCGTWAEGDVESPSRRVFECVVDAICHKLVEAGLNDTGHMNEQSAARLARLLAQTVLRQGKAAARSPVFELRFSKSLPLVAVGAPAASWYPGVANALGMDLALPMHGEVANAVGAVLGRVSQRVHLTVTQPTRGVYRVFTHAGPRDFASLDEALHHAREEASREATALALEAGAAEVEVRTHCDDNSASDDAGNSIFFEARVTASASGPPRESVTVGVSTAGRRAPAP